VPRAFVPPTNLDSTGTKHFDPDRLDAVISDNYCSRREF